MPWDVASVEVHELADSTPAKTLIESKCSSAEFEIMDGGLDDIVAIGEKLWKIVEGGRPVVTVQVPQAHALPRGVYCWTDLDHWQEPAAKTYEVIYKNYFGMQVVKFKFRLQYTFGGGKDGVGHYLANVTVIPADLSVMWGYNFDAQVEVAQAVNLGSRENPLAGLELNLLWQVKTVVNENHQAVRFFVQGDGVVQTTK